MRDYWLRRSLPGMTGTRLSSNLERVTYSLKPKLPIITWLLWAAAQMTPATAQTDAPIKWTKFLRVAGQSEPVPEQWLQDEEARIGTLAYALRKLEHA